MNYWALSVFCLTCGAQAYDVDFSKELAETDAADPRIFFVNFTSSLVQVNATILAYGLIFLAVVGAAAVALYYLYLESASGSSGYGHGYTNQNYGYQQQYARSAGEGFEFSGFNVIKWISMLQDVYEKFDYNDLDCQKKVICEVMREPDFFGTTGRKMKNGFQLARYLEVLNMPDDFRELLDEYMDASERADGQKECEEVYQCPYSLKDSVKRNFSANNL